MLAVKSIDSLCTDFWSLNQCKSVLKSISISIQICYLANIGLFVHLSIMEAAQNPICHHGLNSINTNSKIQTDSHRVCKVHGFWKRLATCIRNGYSKTNRKKDYMGCHNYITINVLPIEDRAMYISSECSYRKKNNNGTIAGTYIASQ